MTSKLQKMSRARLDDSRLSTKEPQQYWGFANFPNQVFRRAIKNGFDFTLMVVGRSGLGKSTFINTLFLAEINDLKEPDAPIPRGTTVRVEEKHVRLVENSVTLNLTLVDTPGFGDAVNNSKCWEPIANYIDGKFLDYFCEETRIERGEKTVDKCVHLCLYFIEPSGHGLKPLDIEVMKQLHTKVNIVPVIAKADCLTKEELKRFKQQVDRDIKDSDIKIYKFPDIEEDNEKAAASHLRDRLPFAVVGSNMVRDHNGKKLRYREYPWGIVEVENLDHNDFIPLRDMVVRTNLIDMVDVTCNVHYENFRFRQMEKLPKLSGDRSRDPFTYMEEEKKQKEAELLKKKNDMDELFEKKIKERESKIAKRNTEISNRQEELRNKVASRNEELDKLRNEISDLKSGNPNGSGDSKSSLNIENVGRLSPDKNKKKLGTLGLFNRN